jgi:hypothetical protein
MSNLTLGNNYSLSIDNISSPKKIKRAFNGPCKFIKQNGNKLVFANGKMTFTLWSNQRSYEYYSCYVTLEKNNNYRITKYELNSNSVYVWIYIRPIELNYLKSHSCSITTLEKFLFLVDFYNSSRKIKKNLKKVTVIAKVFQDYYVTRYISEFL